MAAVAVAEALVPETLEYEPGSISELMMTAAPSALETAVRREPEPSVATHAPARNGTHAPVATEAANGAGEDRREPTFAQRMVDRLFGMLRRAR